MRCPECHTRSEADAIACPGCGLLFLGLKPAVDPKRRKDDLAASKRRSSDALSRKCPLCHGAIEADSIRCRHCSEILDENYRKTKLQRYRANINYASWVAYVFGLLTFLFFKPVGLVAIGAGLLLSITYYAIPVKSEAREASALRRVGAFFKRQFSFERVSLPLPGMRKRRLILVGSPVIATLIGYLANFFFLQQPMNQILQENRAFHGMEVSTHYEYFVIPGVIVYDLKTIDDRQTPVEVQVALLEYAKTLRENTYRRIDLKFRGETKFSLDGASFQKLGQEYVKKNFNFVRLELPQMVRPARAGSPAADPSNADAALLAFHREWYGKELNRQPAAGSAR